MLDITKIDRNFALPDHINLEDIEFHSISEAPIKIYGVFMENGKYRRMPEETAKAVSDGVHSLHHTSSGGRVRFITDSSCIAIRSIMKTFGIAPHSTFSGQAGFDMYVGDRHVKTFIPPLDMKDGFDGIFEFGSSELREITINLPRFAMIEELFIGFRNGAVIKEPTPYRNTKPIVYYGSSITQGGCASRPGAAYQNIVSRRFNYDFINLGFSGSAKGEDAMAEYIKGLDMSVFVYDYDYNTPSAEHLQATHEKMFKTIRAAHPELPIIIMPAPKHTLSAIWQKRHDIIEATYKNAIAAGDRNVYFIDHLKLTELCGDDGTVDNCHPTDLGFASMAKAVGDVLEKISVV